MIHEPELLVYAIAAAVLLVVLWKVDLRPFTFHVRIVDGRPVLRRGKVTAEFLKVAGEVCNKGVTRGWIGGVRRGRRVSLSFSRSIPPPCRQRLRNLWLLHG